MSFQTNLGTEQLKQGLAVRPEEAGSSCLNCPQVKLTWDLNQSSSFKHLKLTRRTCTWTLSHAQNPARVRKLQQSTGQRR